MMIPLEIGELALTRKKKGEGEFYELSNVFLSEELNSICVIFFEHVIKSYCSMIAYMQTKNS